MTNLKRSVHLTRDCCVWNYLLSHSKRRRPVSTFSLKTRLRLNDEWLPRQEAEHIPTSVLERKYVWVWSRHPLPWCPNLRKWWGKGVCGTIPPHILKVGRAVSFHFFPAMVVNLPAVEVFPTPGTPCKRMISPLPKRSIEVSTRNRVYGKLDLKPQSYLFLARDRPGFLPSSFAGFDCENGHQQESEPFPWSLLVRPANPNHQSP